MALLETDRRFCPLHDHDEPLLMCTSCGSLLKACQYGSHVLTFCAVRHGHARTDLLPQPA